MSKTLKEDFTWHSENDGDLYGSFSGLIKNNQGIFKSAKQAKYFSRFEGRTDTDALKKFFNVKLFPGERAIDVSGSAVWARGARGMRPVTWIFILDDLGVVRKYKLKYKGDMAKGTGPDPKKTALEWQREDADDAVRAFKQSAKDLRQADATAAADASANQGIHVGDIKERIRGQAATIEKIFGPLEGQFGMFYVNRIRTSEGNLLVYFGNQLGSDGEAITIDFSVGKHDKDKRTGEPSTIIKRPKVKTEGPTTETTMTTMTTMESAFIHALKESKMRKKLKEVGNPARDNALQKLKDFDKTRTGKSPIFTDQEFTKPDHNVSTTDYTEILKSLAKMGQNDRQIMDFAHRDLANEKSQEEIHELVTNFLNSDDYLLAIPNYLKRESVGDMETENPYPDNEEGATKFSQAELDIKQPRVMGIINGKAWLSVDQVKKEAFVIKLSDALAYEHVDYEDAMAHFDVTEATPNRKKPMPLDDPKTKRATGKAWKKYKKNKEVKEMASGGATGAGAIASVVMPLGKTQRRNKKKQR